MPPNSLSRGFPLGPRRVSNRRLSGADPPRLLAKGISVLVAGVRSTPYCIRCQQRGMVGDGTEQAETSSVLVRNSARQPRQPRQGLQERLERWIRCLCLLPFSRGDKRHATPRHATQQHSNTQQTPNPIDQPWCVSLDFSRLSPPCWLLGACCSRQPRSRWSFPRPPPESPLPSTSTAPWMREKPGTAIPASLAWSAATGSAGTETTATPGTRTRTRTTPGA